MSLLDIICNASDALDLYRNFSCNSQNLEGFKRCYDYASGNTHYYDNGYDDRCNDTLSKTESLKKKTKTYSTDYIRYYKKRIRRLKFGVYICKFGYLIGLFGIVVSSILLVIFFNWESFITLISFVFISAISLVIRPELTDKIFLESNPSLDVWLREHPEFK